MARSEDESLIAIEEILQQLEAVSFVAQRDAREALPSLEGLGPQATLHWLETARDLFFHDREAGKAFMRASPALIEQTGDIDPWVDQALAFRRWVNSWPALEGFMTQAGEVLAAWGESGERDWYEIGMRWCGRNLDDAACYFRTPFKTLADGHGVGGIQQLLAPAERLYDERGLTLDVYLDGAIVARDMVGPGALESWARRGADVMQTGRARGEAFFRLEGEESLRFLLDGIPGYRPRQHGRLLQLLLTAWFGDSIPLADSDWRPGTGRPMVDTDGMRLLLPAVLDSREEAILGVLHAAGHLRYDSYARPEIESLFQHLGEVHPPFDADQRITWRPLYGRFGDGMFRLQVLFDLCEDLRVDARLAELIPGYLQRLLRLADLAPVPEGAAGVYYRFARDSVAKLRSGSAADVRLAALLRPDATLLDAFRVAERLLEDPAFPALTIEEREHAYLPGRGFNTGRPVYPRRRWEQRFGYDADVDAHADNAAIKEKQTEEQPRVTPEMRQTDPDADINIPPENASGSGGRIGVGTPMPAQVMAGALSREHIEQGVSYPEWDYREQRHILDWAWVRERRAEDYDSERAAQILADNAVALKRLRRALEMQRPRRMSPLRRQIEGDELDMEATVSFVVDKHAGLSPKPFIYRRRSEQHRDTAVLLLADMSTSIMARHRSGGKVVDRLRAGLMMFAEAIGDMGDPHAICGFASKHHDNVHYYVIKDFEDPTNEELRGRIAAVSGRLASRMGAAIRHSVRRFDRVDTHHRLLLILSDGRPADYDDGGDQRYLHEDTRMAMKEAVDAGVHPFCLTLDASGSDYLPAIFGPGHYTVLDNIDELPRRLPEVYLRLRR